MDLIDTDVTTTILAGAVGAVIGGLIGAGIGTSISGSKTIQIKGKSQDDVNAVLKKLKSLARFPEYQ